MADISIIDNLTRVLPEMINQSRTLKNYSQSDLQKIVKKFNNKKQINLVLQYMSKRLIDLSTK